MKLSHWAKALPAAAVLAMTAAPVAAQRPPSAEQQIAILRQQLAASQASAVSLSQRLDAVERQLQQLINAEEQNGHRVGEVESGLSQLQTSQGARMDALEQKIANLAAAPPAAEVSESAPEPVAKPAQTSKPKPQTASATPAKPAPASQDESVRQTVPVSDPGEDAYSEGFHLWRDGDYQGAIKSLRAFVKDYPDHPRISYARNLIGRALLDQGQPRAAATELLANYRADPGGARAQDSLYYLGQALMKLNQPERACNAYAELDNVFGAKLRPELKDLLAKGKADAGCH